MYSIGNIVYGVNIRTYPDFKTFVYTDDGFEILQELKYKDTHYFESDYSGDGDAPYWFGVCVGSIDPCDSIDDLPAAMADWNAKANKTDFSQDRDAAVEEARTALKRSEQHDGAFKSDIDDFCDWLKRQPAQLQLLWSTS